MCEDVLIITHVNTELHVTVTVTVTVTACMQVTDQSLPSSRHNQINQAVTKRAMSR